MSNNGYVIPVDPSELATRYSQNPGAYDEEEGYDPELAELENVSTDDASSFFSSGDLESRIGPLLEQIPKREADLIKLYFVTKKRQADLAIIFGVTQAAISYRLARGIQRLKFLIDNPQISEEELRSDLPVVFPTQINCPRCHAFEGTCQICEGNRTIYVDVEILVGMWRTTCQTVVASKLGLTQGRVRHRFFKAVKVLKEVARTDERFAPYQALFSSVSKKNFNIRREVKLPQWADRGGDECF